MAAAAVGGGEEGDGVVVVDRDGGWGMLAVWM